MQLIDVSYFTSGPRQIQNASTAQMPLQASIAVNDAIEGYIKAYQNEFLLDIVGRRLAGHITDYLDMLDQEKDDLKDEAQDTSETEPVAGLSVSPYETICRKIREPFADYVFFHILRDMNTQATITGLVRLKCANDYVAPIQRQVSIWNDMVKKNKEFVHWASSEECNLNVVISANLLTPINAFNI